MMGPGVALYWYDHFVFTPFINMRAFAATVLLCSNPVQAFSAGAPKPLRTRCCGPHCGILKGIDPILSADLLYALRAAGHGDVIAVVDANFPAASTAQACVLDEPIVLAGVDCVTAMAAIGSVLPIDRFVETPVGKMVPSEGLALPALGAEVHEQAVAALGDGIGVQEVERFDFYSIAEDAFVIVQCVGERRPYGCFLLTKGVVGPDGNDLMP